MIGDGPLKYLDAVPKRANAIAANTMGRADGSTETFQLEPAVPNRHGSVLSSIRTSASIINCPPKEIFTWFCAAVRRPVERIIAGSSRPSRTIFTAVHSPWSRFSVSDSMK